MLNTALFTVDYRLVALAAQCRIGSLKSAPSAIGLVRAKTGTLNGTVSLAGYVQGGNQEYIFVAIADQIPRGTTAAKAARTALDKVLAKFATASCYCLCPAHQRAHQMLSKTLMEPP